MFTNNFLIRIRLSIGCGLLHSRPAERSASCMVAEMFRMLINLFGDRSVAQSEYALPLGTVDEEVSAVVNDDKLGIDGFGRQHRELHVIFGQLSFPEPLAVFHTDLVVQPLERFRPQIRSV